MLSITRIDNDRGASWWFPLKPCPHPFRRNFCSLVPQSYPECFQPKEEEAQESNWRFYNMFRSWVPEIAYSSYAGEDICVYKSFFSEILCGVVAMAIFLKAIELPAILRNIFWWVYFIVMLFQRFPPLVNWEHELIRSEAFLLVAYSIFKIALQQKLASFLEYIDEEPEVNISRLRRKVQGFSKNICNLWFAVLFIVCDASFHWFADLNPILAHCRSTHLWLFWCIGKLLAGFCAFLSFLHLNPWVAGVCPA